MIERRSRGLPGIRMGSRRRVLAVAAVVTAALGAPLGVVGDGSRAYAQPAPEQAGQHAERELAGPTKVLPAGEAWTVTLLTGEVVDVRADADGRVSALVRKHSGPYSTVRKPDGEVYVFPLSVAGLLGRVLDLELFNVTGLVRQGYHDATSDVVPVIVKREPGANVQATMHSGKGGQQLSSIGATAVHVPKKNTEATGQRLQTMSAKAGPKPKSVDGITHVWLDRQVTARFAPSARRTFATPTAPAPARKLDGNLTQIGADDAWRAGFTGDGATVAVLDTGVDADHPDVAGKIVAKKNFSGSDDIVDRVGHGTHVAATAAGSGAAADGARRGVAPDADLVIGKVIGDDGFGAESDAIAGMEWAAPKADVVNMSIGVPVPTDGSDPASTAVDELTEQYDTLFVVSAGNIGPGSKTIGSPAAADRALTVGAVDGDDALADFSSRGPLYDSYELKPGVVAPGVDIIAARAAGTAMGEPADADYTSASGTSMAAPHVAGAAAVLAGQRPDWTADQIKHTLIGSSDPIGEGGYDAGAGRIDIGDAVTTEVHAGRDIVDVPLAHPRTKPHTEKLAWTNTGDTPATVKLAASLTDRVGNKVEEMTVKPGTLTIGPGDTASATVRIDGPDLDRGLYSGVVTATAKDGSHGGDTGAGTVRTPIGVHAEPKMVDLTIKATPPAESDTPPMGIANIVNLEDSAGFGMHFHGFEGETHTLQVPAGRYSVAGTVTTGDPDNLVVAQVGDPNVTVNNDTTVAFDGAAAVPFNPTVEGVKDAQLVTTKMLMSTPVAAGTADGKAAITEIFVGYPVPLHVTAMDGRQQGIAVGAAYRLQAPHIAARVGGQVVPITTVPGAGSGDVTVPPAGEHSLAAVDAGDGSDLSGTRDKLALVQLPADQEERAAITQRAADAGTAILAFTDEKRPRLTLTADSDVPLVAAGGKAATALRAAAATGDDVTITSTPSPYVYDIVAPESQRVAPSPVITKAEQAKLATLKERFHHDPDGTGPRKERRVQLGAPWAYIGTYGPLPQRRTAHVTPGVTWQSLVYASVPVDDSIEPRAISLNTGRSYASGSRHTLTWLRRPQWPGPVGGPPGASGCQPFPVRRSGDTLHVELAAFQDGRDRFTCAGQLDQATHTLERDGTPIEGSETDISNWLTSVQYVLPPDRGTYRLSYERTGQAPYDHRSTTTWTFQSAAPDDPGAEILVPLLVVDYNLPLDTLNRPTGDTATFTVAQVTGTKKRPIRSMKVWTSTDDGETWHKAPTRRGKRGTNAVTLPDVKDGTGVSIRVDAKDVDGNRIQQTLYDAYYG